MIRTCFFISSSLCCTLPATAQSLFGLAWQVSIGGTLTDYAHGLAATTGGYWVLGESQSDDGQVVGNHGATDFWLALVDESGSMMWQRCYGGAGQDRGFAIHAMSTGGCAFVGETFSDNGDISDYHAGGDAWVALANDEGDLIWQRAFGGTGREAFNAIRETPDGGLIVVGYARSSDGDVIGHQGDGTYGDFWTLRLDADGELEWQSTIGGTLNDTAHGLCVTEDGGAIVVGETSSSDGQVVAAHGGVDAWVCRLSPAGALLWSRALGGSQDDIAYDVVAMSDGGALVVGKSRSNDGDVFGAHGAFDAWVVRLSSSGGVIWQRPLGGTYDDFFYSIATAGPGTFLLAGSTYSLNGNVTGNHGFADAWLVLIDEFGALLSQSCFGGSHIDGAEAVIPSPLGGFLFAGSSTSADGDVTVNQGQPDYWVARIADYTGMGSIDRSAPISMSPNPASDRLRVSLPLNEIAQITIVDMQGRTAMRTSVRGPEVWLELSGLASGLYCVRADLDMITVQKLLVVE